MRAYRLISGALTWAVRLKMLGRNVAENISPPAVPLSSATAQNLEDASQLFVEADKCRWGPYVYLALLFGPRRGELLAIKRHLVDIKAAQVTIAGSISQTRESPEEKETKSDRVRSVNLS